MLQNYNKWRVLAAFFEDPLAEGGYQLRELGRKAKLAPTSVRNYLKELKADGLVTVAKSRHGFPVYVANIEGEAYRFYKKTHNLTAIFESGLLDYIQDACMPDVVVLFGSAAKGEDIKGSDIDLYVQCRERKLGLQKFEKAIGKKVNVFFSEDFSRLSNELKNNIINGIKLKGYLKVF